MQRPLLTSKLLLSSILLLSCVAIAHANNADGSPFLQPIANPFEARIGSMVQVDDECLRLDIGASFDLFEPVERSDSGWMRIGIDFLTWTRLRSETNFKFPVETIDYWFGVHGSYRFGATPLQTRLRIAHISSHMVDGLADTTATISPTPFVYSREFAELLFAYELVVFRPYAGATFVWTKQPASPNPVVPQFGVDVDKSLSTSIRLQGGYDLKLIGIDGAYVATHAAQLGVRIAAWNNTGLFTGIYGYSGRSMHGMFYTTYDSYIGIGIQFLP